MRRCGRFCLHVSVLKWSFQSIRGSAYRALIAIAKLLNSLHNVSFSCIVNDSILSTFHHVAQARTRRLPLV